MYKLAILCLFLLPPRLSFAQRTPEVLNAVLNKDLIALIQMPQNIPGDEVLDALSTRFDFNNFTYEDLISLQDRAIQSTVIDFLGTMIQEHEIKIMKQLPDLTLEQLVKYENEFPKRQPLVDKYIREYIAPQIPNMTYKELSYIKRVFPELEPEYVEIEIANRASEKHDIMAQHVKEFTKKEWDSTVLVEYSMEMIIWSFFVEGHKTLTNAYSQISLVPDNPYEAVDQYQKLVKACFPLQHLRIKLQEQVNLYCEQVNKARADYATISGQKSGFPRLQYTVPVMSLNSYANSSVFENIRSGRDSFIHSRENINAGSGIITWLTGGIYGLVAKGLGDWLAISGLVDSEYKTRLQYVQEVHDAILYSFSTYTNNLISSFESEMQKNEDAYEKFIKK